MTSARILIVEDDRIVARDIEQQLKRLGHTVVGMTSRGEDVLALTLERAPDLVLMDIRLEGEADGIDAAQQIRTRSSVPVIFLTAYADDPTVLRATQAEPFGYLLKPFEESQLSTTISMALYKHAAEQRLRASERRYAVTLSSIGDAVIATDADGVITFMNPVAEQMTGTTSADGLGRPLSSVFQIVDEPILLARDGREITIESSRAPILDEHGVSAGAVLVFRDTTQRRAESELRFAKEAAEASNRAKDEFLANVSHEIRTPMNAILGMTELVLDTSLSEAQRQSLRTVRSAATSLLAIINDLLDFSKIEAGKVELDRDAFQLRALLGDVMRALAVRAHRKGLELLCQIAPDAPDALIGDAGRLRQVLINLVGNAIKFTARGEVQVDVTFVGQNDADVELLFAVRDTGIGISLDKQDTIFRAFEQEDMSTTRRYGGTGLGLTIASRFVTMMGGAIHVESAPQRGSIFSFHAHFGWREQGAVSQIARTELGRLRVLIVDDNAANRAILEQWLLDWRMEASSASDALTAMDALWHAASSRRPYELVLLDARMPDTDGLSIAAKIRDRAELAGTRIVLLTSGDRPGDIERSRELRIDAHLLKPVPQDELYGTIYEVMTRSQREVTPTSTSVRTAAETPSSASLPLRILIAEDNAFNSQLLQQLLESRGHAVRVAHDGREALAYARSGGFDLMFLDLHMPELDGFQVIQALREHERTAGGHLFTIALTARSRIEDRARCVAAGMDDFLAKPIHAAALWNAIERMTFSLPGRAPSEEQLIDADVLLAACGGDPRVLDSIRDGLRSLLPEELVAVERAFALRNAPLLREAAHRVHGMVAAFSGAAGRLASALEDAAANGELDAAAPLIARLRALAPQLVAALDAVTIESLREP